MKRLLSITTALLASVTLLMGCSNDDKKKEKTEDDSESMTVTVFDKNSKSSKFDDRIAKIVEEKTGVKVEIQNPTGDPDEKLSLLLSSNDYPDIVLMELGSDNLNKYINSGAFIELDELIEEKMPNVKEMYGNILNKTRHTDGHNYYLANWYNKELIPDPVDGWLFKYDIMVDLVGKERADSPEPFSEDELLALFKEFKEKYPEIDGKESIALTGNADNMAFFRKIKGMFGIKQVYEKDNNIYWDVKDPQFIKMLHFTNELYREGILDSEWVSMKEQTLTQKLSTGSVFGTIAAWWDAGQANDTLKAEGGDEAQYVGYTALADGVSLEEATYNGRNSLGWDAIGITDNVKNIDAATKLVDFLASREGQNLLMWGVEGEDYDVVDGEFIPKAEVADLFLKDGQAAIKETGISRWTWFVTGEPPTPTSTVRLSGYEGNKTFTAQKAKTNLISPMWDTAYMDNLSPEGSTPEGLKEQKVKDVYNQSIAAIINAESAEKVDELFTKLLDDMENAGMSDVEKIYTENYQARMKLWGE